MAASFELAAGGEQQNAIELARCQFRQPRRQIDDRARQDRRVEVVELADGAAHHFDDLGMAVADDGTHLPGAEIEDAPALRIPHEAALRSLGDDGHEVAAVSDEMRARLLPERRVGIALRALTHVVHAVLLGPPHGEMLFASSPRVEIRGSILAQPLPSEAIGRAGFFPEQPRDVAHLAPVAGLALAVEMQAGAGLGGKARPIERLLADQVESFPRPSDAPRSRAASPPPRECGSRTG